VTVLKAQFHPKASQSLETLVLSPFIHGPFIHGPSLSLSRTCVLLPIHTPMAFLLSFLFANLPLPFDTAIPSSIVLPSADVSLAYFLYDHLRARPVQCRCLLRLPSIRPLHSCASPAFAEINFHYVIFICHPQCTTSSVHGLCR